MATIETAFHVNMRTYKHPTESRNFYAPDSEPTMDLPFNLWHISGLNNYSIPHAMLVNKNDYAAAHGMRRSRWCRMPRPAPARRLRSWAATCARRTTAERHLTGAGQNLGLLEYLRHGSGGPEHLLHERQPDEQCSHHAAFDGWNQHELRVQRSGCDDTEQTLDMTQALGMAPGLSSLVMYVGSSDTAIIGAMTTH